MYFERLVLSEFRLKILVSSFATLRKDPYTERRLVYYMRGGKKVKYISPSISSA